MHFVGFQTSRQESDRLAELKQKLAGIVTSVESSTNDMSTANSKDGRLKHGSGNKIGTVTKQK